MMNGKTDSRVNRRGVWNHNSAARVCLNGIHGTIATDDKGNRSVVEKEPCNGECSRWFRAVFVVHQ